jgi:hypothetical protein
MMSSAENPLRFSSKAAIGLCDGFRNSQLDGLPIVRQ